MMEVGDCLSLKKYMFYTYITRSIDKVWQGKDEAGQRAEENSPSYPTRSVPLSSKVGEEE